MSLTMDNLPDQLQSKVFHNLVDLADFQNCRLVSQKWKRNVMEACRNKFHLVYPLTGSTLFTVSHLKDTLVSFDIYAFTGKENEEAWPTSGIELLMQTTEWLQFSGSEVSAEEIRKILGLAHNSLKTLYFKCLKTGLTCAFLELRESFSALRKLSIGYYSIEKCNDTFTTFTNTLEKWNSLDCRVQLPLLESLNLYFDTSAGLEYDRFRFHVGSVPITTEDLFRNYIAIAKLLLKYKKTLREVQIERVFNLYLYPFAPYSVPSGWTEMERGLEALDELNLDQLKLSTKRKQAYTFENYDLEIEVLGRPKNLKNVLFNNLICPHDNWYPLITTLSGFNNVDSRYLTSVRISLVLRDWNDPTLAINLGGLKDCMNLRTLWLKINTSYIRKRLLVKNVELLPKGISILHFESAEKYWTTMGKEILVNQRQLRWIIDNLRELESFRMSLVIPEQTNANENNVQGADADADINDVAQRQQQQEDINRLVNINLNAQRQQQQEDINRLVSINLNAFRDLLAIPTLKNVKVNMMKALSIVAGTWPMLGVPTLGTTLDDIREYCDMCEDAGYTTTTTTTPYFGARQIFGFATLTIQRNQN